MSERYAERLSYHHWLSQVMISVHEQMRVRLDSPSHHHADKV
jgi:hypothetical protein